MAQGFRARSPRIHRLSSLKKHLIQGARSDSRRKTIIIMHATLHDRAPNTY
jgi:hypothetical protein